MFSAEVVERGDSYVVEVPAREVELDSVHEGSVYRVVVLDSVSGTESEPEASTGGSPESRPEPATAPDGVQAEPAASETAATDSSSAAGTSQSTSSPGEPEPPVDRGDELVVDIESIGDQGDGIARVDRGYVIIVPDTDKGERVRITVTSVKQNVAFGEVVDRIEGHIFE